MVQYPVFSDQPLPTGRVAAIVAYTGTRYSGWQSQKHSEETVQGHVERALSAVAGAPVSVTCAGRTDAGVHAAGQVIHFDVSVSRSPKAWIMGANHHLPADIRLVWANTVDPAFHARYSALSRRYQYILVNQPVAPAWCVGNLGWYHKRLDEQAMDRAAQQLVGEHDFSAFRAAECQSRTPVRRLTRIRVRRDGDLICVDVEGNAFLHHMVRNIVGTLIYVGCGRQPESWVGEVLDSRDRRQGGPTAPASGLYFCRVTYPEHFDIPARAVRLPFRGVE
ncbi:tRNA pseudouridine(38-40) synthase TruA [Hahella sp. SMD15-11]|uniref:tRNA pseudouridine synthase A n=1 Tax=Thermohahella caldifontis TaxID=3142973 RepID=A0AB39UX98_9GAMM